MDDVECWGGASGVFGKDSCEKRTEDVRRERCSKTIDERAFQCRMEQVVEVTVLLKQSDFHKGLKNAFLRSVQLLIKYSVRRTL